MHSRINQYIRLYTIIHVGKSKWAFIDPQYLIVVHYSYWLQSIDLCHQSILQRNPLISSGSIPLHFSRRWDPSQSICIKKAASNVHSLYGRSPWQRQTRIVRTSAHHLEFFRTVLYDTLSLSRSPLSDGLDRLSYSTLLPTDPSTVVVVAHINGCSNKTGCPPPPSCIMIIIIKNRPQHSTVRGYTICLNPPSCLGDIK